MSVDRISKAVRSKMMASVKNKNTGPEIVVRKLLHKIGFRFRINIEALPGKPDIVLSKYKTIIFVHGCFWHKHNCKKGSTTPKTNTDFWTNKIGNNVLRDKKHINGLTELGWNVIVIWECETKCHQALMKIISKNLPQLKTTH